MWLTNVHFSSSIQTMPLSSIVFAPISWRTPLVCGHSIVLNFDYLLASYFRPWSGSFSSGNSAPMGLLSPLVLIFSFGLWSQSIIERSFVIRTQSRTCLNELKGFGSSHWNIFRLSVVFIKLTMIFWTGIWDRRLLWLGTIKLQVGNFADFSWTHRTQWTSFRRPTSWHLFGTPSDK